jgi:hypothetical protein
MLVAEGLMRSMVEFVGTADDTQSTTYPALVATRSAGQLRTGDVIRTPDGAPAEVLCEPLTAHHGWSPFDEFELLVLVRLRELSPGSKSAYVRWRRDEPIELL